MSVVSEKPSKTYSRLNVRLSPDIKLRVQKAAHILGQDLTAFTEDTLNSRALEVIEANSKIVLEEKEYQFFLDLLAEKPAEPTKKSLEARKRYREMISRGDLIIRD